MCQGTFFIQVSSNTCFRSADEGSFLVCLSVNLIDSIFIKLTEGSDSSCFLIGTAVGQFADDMILLFSNILIFPESHGHSQRRKILSGCLDTCKSQLLFI